MSNSNGRVKMSPNRLSKKLLRRYQHPQLNPRPNGNGRNYAPCEQCGKMIKSRPCKFCIARAAT